MVRDIVLWPDPILSKPTAPVKAVDDSIRALVNDMFETMYSAEGVGLAAPQVGVGLSVLVLDTTPRQPESRPIAMINPEILKLEGEIRFNEGCLSLPGESEDVDRAALVTVRYLDVDGQSQTLEADGLLAIAIQHEHDHLLGKVFVEYVSVLKRQLIKKRMQRMKAERAEAVA
jgi:peptide deformylase